MSHGNKYVSTAFVWIGENQAGDKSSEKITATSDYKLSQFEKSPAIRSVENFNPIEDAAILKKALKSYKTEDKKTIIDIIVNCSNKQRQELQSVYKTTYGRELSEHIKSKASGNFAKVLIALLTPKVDFYVEQIHKAMAGLGTDEEALVEFLCGLPNKTINTITQTYHEKYKTTLEKDIIGDTSGDFKRLLVALCAAGRDENAIPNRQQAIYDAEELLNAGEIKLGTDESKFNSILCSRSYKQIKAINDEYQILTGHSLQQAIEKEFSGSIKKGLVAIIQCSIDRREYFAQQLHKSMAGLGTNDDQLIRIIVSRSEFDLLDIKSMFEKKYGKTLKHWIDGDTSGSYKKSLLAIIREEF